MSRSGGAEWCHGGTRAGFFSLFAPRRFGAHEADPRTAVEVLAELGRADGSTAWVAATLSAASYLASLLGERGRRDVWSEDPYATVCGALSLTGTGLAKSGGVVVTGVLHVDSQVPRSRTVRAGPPT